MKQEEIKKLIFEKETQKSKLSQEIEELKKMLDYNDKPSKMSLDEKLKLFNSYFKGRDDVYAKLSIDKKDSTKKYYVPVCINEWKQGVCNWLNHGKCKNCQYKQYKPITLTTIEEHIYNNKTMGIYPLLDDDSCYFLAFDFDDKKDEKNIKDDVLAFASICDRYNISFLMERSRSGKGVHIWIFFENKIKALTARKLGSLLLSKTMEIRDNLKINSFDRMFPNQDYLPKGGFGNLIVLPFQTEPMKYQNTMFIDRNFLTIEKQFTHLKNTKKMSEDDVFEKIKVLSNNTIDISHEIKNMKNDIKDKNKNNVMFPKTIDVTLDNMIYIDKGGLNAGTKSVFRRLAMFANPEFYQKQRMRMNTYNIPMVIDCSKENEKYLMLPRGTYEYLCELCSENNVKMNITDIRNNGNKIKVKFNGKLKKEQSTALNNLIKYDNGILSAPTGFGKTVIGCKLIEQQKVNTLVLVNKIQLLNQWKDRIKEFLDIEEVGEISSKKKKITNVVDIASIKSIWNNGDVLDIINNYGMIIVDECHHTAAYTFEQTINSGNAKYIYGISATPERENGHTPIIKMQCGDIRYEVDTLKFNKDLDIPMKVIVKNSHLNFTDPKIDNYEINEINDFISKDIVRSDKIIEDIKREYDNNKNILVLTERLEHLDYIYNKLSQYTNNIFKYHGGLGKKTLKSYEEHLNMINEQGVNKIIVATGSCIGEGFDDSKLDVLFLTMPISGNTRLTQYVGRLHRKNENKKEILVYDYVDDNFAKTRNMFLKREKHYKKMGYEIIKDSETFKLL